MKIIILTLLFTLTTFISAFAANSVVFEQVNLTKSASIKWEGKNNKVIDALLISDSVSIQLQNCSDITISACDIASINLVECKRITIRNSWIHDSLHNGIEMYKSQKVLVQGCRMENVSSGVYAIESQQIQVIGNFTRNMKGPFPRGQMAQFDTVTGENNVIRDNYAINDRGKSHPEDVKIFIRAPVTKIHLF